MLSITKTDNVSIKRVANTKGYDGHCLRAYAYFKDQMPDIELARENEICYTAKVGDKFIDFTENQLICYKGETLTGKQLWELLQDSRK